MMKRGGSVKAESAENGMESGGNNGTKSSATIGVASSTTESSSGTITVVGQSTATMAMELCKASPTSTFLSMSNPPPPMAPSPLRRSSPLLLSAVPSSSAASFTTAASPPRRKASVPVLGPVDCLICSDRATGKHYGSISCDGCKGFFRRTIRKKHNYVCRFSRNCVVDKNQRNSCRRCRFDKCLAHGMRPEAVQLERDRIAATRRGSGNAREAGSENAKDCSGSNENNELLTSSSVAAEQTLQRLTEAERTLKAVKGASSSGKAAMDRGNCRTATTGDVTDSMNQQLILLVEWAKQLEEFRRLPLCSQIALLRHFSGQHLVLCAAFRSLYRVAEIDAVWLANDRCVPRDAPKIPDVNRVVARILDHLTGPMRRLHLKEREFVALKAVAFFDPMAKDIDESCIADVEEARRQILAAFEHQVQRVSEHRETMPLRMADLLLLLPPLMAISRDLVEEAQLAKLFGLANVDELMAELLLPEDAETRSYSRLRTSVTSSIVQSNVTSPTPSNSASSPRHHRSLLLSASGKLPNQQHSPLFPTATSSSVAIPSPISNGNSQQQQSAASWVLAAPTPIYSPSTPFLFAGSIAGQHWHQLNGATISTTTADIAAVCSSK